jgi:hypothetical protein
LGGSVTTSNQPTVLFSHNKPALATSHQPNEQAHIPQGKNDENNQQIRLHVIIDYCTNERERLRYWGVMEVP